MFSVPLLRPSRKTHITILSCILDILCKLLRFYVLFLLYNIIYHNIILLVIYYIVLNDVLYWTTEMIWTVSAIVERSTRIKAYNIKYYYCVYFVIIQIIICYVYIVSRRYSSEFRSGLTKCMGWFSSQTLRLPIKLLQGVSTTFFRTDFEYRRYTYIISFQFDKIEIVFGVMRIRVLGPTCSSCTYPSHAMLISLSR